MFCFGQFNANLKYLAKTSIQFSWWEYTPKCWIFPSHSSFSQWIRWPSWPTAGPYSTNLWRSQWIGFATGKSTGNHLGYPMADGIPWYPMTSHGIPWKVLMGKKKHTPRGAHQQRRAKETIKKWFTNMRQHANSGTCQSWGSIQGSITSIIMIIMA